MNTGPRTLLVMFVTLALLAGCSGGGGGSSGGQGASASSAESCMTCHNASLKNDYKGPGIANPHPFAGANKLKCTTCHGGNPKGEDKDSSHVPTPPFIGDDANLIADRTAYFNRLTLTGLDRLDDYEVGGKTYTALDFLQFINPGDLRVVQDGRSCGACHSKHVDDVSASVLATATGIFSGASFASGSDNKVPESDGLYGDTAADTAFRAISDEDYSLDPSDVGAISRLLEYPVISAFGDAGPDALHDNPAYDAASLAFDREADNQVVTGSHLDNLYHEQIAFTCGDCHLGSAGANNRYGDFRSSGCTACHMPYSQSGRYEGTDPNIDKLEPLDVDQIAAPERSHVRSHTILSTARTEQDGSITPGIDDYSCAGCHQGSNRTVMQFWGIRLDQNEDLRRGVQYPLQPVSFEDTRDDPRLFDPVIGNDTFNGRRDRQYILFEDYDGDGRDDTPMDVHYEAGMGCIDCHGSYDLHGGDTSENGADLYSRMEHGVAVRCTTCHGTVEAYADTVAGQTFAGGQGQVVVDAAGNKVDHVVRENDGHYYLTSKLTGARHFVPQTRDTVVDSGVENPLEPGEFVYTQRASYAMGRADGDPGTGLGPLQASGYSGFAHTDDMDCQSCHAAWTNTCSGCHLEGEYDTNPANHSNITGERIVFREKNADFVYQSPLPMQLGIGPHGKITQTSANTKAFFSYEDQSNDESDVFAFSDRRGQGNNPLHDAPALSHNAIMAHSIRGRVTPENEGVRSCTACHLTDAGLASFGEANYDAFRSAMAGSNYDALDFDQLATHIGANTGNTLESPLFVHMVAGLGSGLFLFDEHGCPVNPLDDDDDRAGCDGTAPADVPFDEDRVAFDLDRVVAPDGTSYASSNHALLEPAASSLRDGAGDPTMAGPLGATLIERLTDPDTGIVLDSWVDADAAAQGNAGTWVTDDP